MRLVVGLIALLFATSVAAQSKVPSPRALEALVKVSLISFNDANVTGNYTVFHAKLSKPFREQFPPARLKTVFDEFSRKKLDFDIIAADKPVYEPAPKVDDDGRLSVKGHFPTEPVKVWFDLDFIPEDGEWKLIRINVKVGDRP